MAIRSDSYGTVAEVVPMVKISLGEESTFNAVTTPTLAQVEKMIDRVSGVLNLAFSNCGFTVPINSTNANSTAKLACDNWVVGEVAAMVEMARPARSFGGAEESRNPFMGLNDRAKMFVNNVERGLMVVGATRTRRASTGLTFTGLDAKKNRNDPSNTALEQPKFTRRDFDAGSSQKDSTSVWGSS